MLTRATESRSPAWRVFLRNSSAAPPRSSKISKRASSPKAASRVWRAAGRSPDGNTTARCRCFECSLSLSGFQVSVLTLFSSPLLLACPETPYTYTLRRINQRNGGTPGMKEQTRHRAGWFFLLGLILIALFGIRTLSSPDVWTHLSLGRHIAEEGFPKTEYS